MNKRLFRSAAPGSVRGRAAGAGRGLGRVCVERAFGVCVVTCGGRSGRCGLAGSRMHVHTHPSI